MTTYYVIRESDGDTYAAASFAAAVIAAQPENHTRFVAAAVVDAPDAGAARLLMDHEGHRRSDLQPPVAWRVWALDVWGNAEDGYEVNDRREHSHILLSNDMSNDDVRAVLTDAGWNATKGVAVEWHEPDYIEIDSSDDGKPLLQLERV